MGTGKRRLMEKPLLAILFGVGSDRYKNGNRRNLNRLLGIVEAAIGRLSGF